ncbi:MAG: XRE family transcriptional regulator [Candidatus Omnitrophota bacterium]|nr:XRE family transcriptional regulator [Candidatus Omnitrophota bacterium]
MKIGSRIKDLRIQQRITLKELAKKTGLTTSFLSQLERDLTSPSISSLEKISGALNTKVGYFFEKEERKDLVFIKKGMGKKSADKEGQIVFESLAAGLLNIKMEPFIFTLGINAELTKEVIYPEGEKFGMVLTGKIELSCGDEKFIVEEGDSIYCAFTRKIQRIVNIGENEAKLLLVVFFTGLKI